MNTSLNTNDPERAREALPHIDPSCPRDEWVRIGMAAKSAGLSFDDFHDWSANGSNYKSRPDCLAAWRSFKESGGITAATLIAKALEQGWTGTAHPTKVSHAQRNPVKIPDNPAPKTWEMCIPAPPDHPYIVRKHGQPDGLRIYPVDAPPLIINKLKVAGWLAVPVWFEGQLQTIQFIPPNIDGKKLNHRDASTNDGYFTVGNLLDGYAGGIHIVEGIGQAWAANQTAGFPAVSCFGASRMAKVAKVLRRKYPNAKLVIVPDKGKETEAEKIAAAVSGYYVVMPADKPSNYDINDFRQEYGPDALAGLLSQTIQPKHQQDPHMKQPEPDYSSMPDYGELPPMGEQSPQNKKPFEFKRVSLSDVFTNPPERQRYVLESAIVQTTKEKRGPSK
jgi:putative DNA primase/helicase